MIKLYGKNILRQGVAIVVAVALIFTGFGGAINPSIAFGNESAVIADKIIVDASFQSEGSFDFAKQDIAVSNGLAETYGYKDEVKAGISSLDVLVRLHEVSMGLDEITEEDEIVEVKETIKEMLVVGSSGFVTMVMGVDGSKLSFTINGEQPVDKGTTFPGGNGFPESYLAYTVAQSEVKEGDSIEFFILQDTSYMDNYTWFEHGGKRVDYLKVLPETNVSLNLKGIIITYYGAAKDKSKFIKPIVDAPLVLTNKGTGTSQALEKIKTDDDGKANLSFDKPGEYIVSIESPEYEFCTLPWLEVTVLDPTDNIPTDIPSDDIKSRVTISAGNSLIVGKQPLGIGWFDLRPFISNGAETYVLTNEILTAHSLVEAVYFKLYGTDATREDLNISANSTTAQGIRENLDVSNGGWGLSINSVYKDSNIKMSAINDDFKSSMGIGSDVVTNNSDIVFYPYINGYDFGSFDVLKVSTRIEFECPVVILKLKIKKDNWDLGISNVEGAKIFKAGDNSYVYGETGSNGIVTAEFWGDKNEEQGSFLITAEAQGLIAPCLKVNYDFDKLNSKVTITDTSKGVLADTSLSKFTIDAYGAEINVENYVNNNLPFEVKSTVENITLSAVTTDNDAIINFPGTNIDNTTGGSVSIPLKSGENIVALAVTNGKDVEKYTFKIIKNQGGSNVFIKIDKIISGITGYANYADGVFDSNYIIGKIGAGKIISEKEKNAFLTQVVNTAGNANVGNQAKMAIALTALNIDATKVPVQGSDATINLVEKVYNNSANSIYLTFLPYMLLLEDLGNYEIPKEAKWGRENLIKYILDNYNGFSGWNVNSGVDGAALMIPALAPYYKNFENQAGHNGISMETCEKVKEKVDQVIADLKNMQQPNGSFGNNTNSTAVVISALSSLGIDSNGDEFTKKGSGKSLLEAIFTFETADSRLGFASTTYNQLASSDGLQALSSYMNYYNNGAKNGDGSIYRFKKDIAPYTKWPNAKLLTAIILTPPTKTTYSKGEPLDTTGMKVKAVYNSQDSTAQDIENGYNVSSPDMSTAGSKTVKVDYAGQQSSFVVTVKDQAIEEVKTISLSVKDSEKTIASSSKLVIEAGKTTVLEALQRVLNSAGKSVTIKGGSYVAEIDGKGEFDGGKNSGWLYNVNGISTTTPAGEYVLKGDENVLWYYTLDYTKDPGSSSWQPEPVAPSVADGKASATTTVEAKTDAKGEAKVTISSTTITDTLNKAIEAAKKENKDGKKNVIPEVAIEVKANNNTKSITVTMPKNTLSDIVKAGGVLAVNTPTGSLSFDGEALKILVEGAGGSDISLTMEIVESGKNPVIDGIKSLKDRPVFNIAATSGEKAITNFKNGKVTMALPYKLKDKEKGENLRITFVSEDGKQEDLGKPSFDSVKGQVHGVSNHFSYYAITYKDTNTQDIQFTDVTKTDWFYNSVMNLATKGIVKGKSESKFEPLGKITRAEFVQILYNISGKTTGESNGFTDVKDSDWFSKSVNWAASNNLVKGFENTFNPNANITRQDMSVILINYIKIIEKKNIVDKNLVITFNDEREIADYAKDAVKEMAKGGIINGIKNSDGSYSFKPQEHATRGESATMISNYLQ